MLKDDVQDTGLKGHRFTVPHGPIADDCRHSSRAFAQAYQYAVDQLGGAVPFGSDFNGIAGHLGPRFGSDACDGDGDGDGDGDDEGHHRPGRVYTIEVECTGGSKNSARATTLVAVTKD